jgi:hypothetical protein
MEHNLKKMRFIELRAEELSLEKISKEINVSKPTLIKWSREFALDIQNQKSLIIDSLKDELLFSRRKNLESLRSFLLNVEKELMQRDLKDLSTDKLFKVYTELKTQLSSELNVTYKEEEKFSVEFPEKVLVSWEI